MIYYDSIWRHMILFTILYFHSMILWWHVTWGILLTLTNNKQLINNNNSNSKLTWNILSLSPLASPLCLGHTSYHVIPDAIHINIQISVSMIMSYLHLFLNFLDLSLPHISRIWHDIWHMTYDIWRHMIWHMTFGMWHAAQLAYDIRHKTLRREAFTSATCLIPSY